MPATGSTAAPNVVKPRLVKKKDPVPNQPPTIKPDLDQTDRVGQAPYGVFPFWMVWKNMRKLPRFRHATEADAWTEARRLSLLFPNKKFYVVRVEGSVKTTTTDGLDKVG